MTRFTFLLSAVVLCLFTVSSVQAEDLSQIEWETSANVLIGDPNAKQGGTFRTWINAYPLTFRLVGPDSNDGFSGWKRSFSQDFTLAQMHPTTDEWIPLMATHWKTMPDGKTIYFKLDPDATWSDGKPITASDYVFTWEMCQSPHIVDPFYNQYMLDYYESVEALDTYTLKIVGKQKSWRPLYEYNLWPMPRHVHDIKDGWVKDMNLVTPTVPGPYVITEQQQGKKVVFERTRPWWGDGKERFKGLFNVDKIDVLVVLDTDKAYDHFVKGDINFLRMTTAKTWAEMDLEAVDKGWVQKKRIFVDYPQGMYGFAMNVQKPPFTDVNFRKALQYSLDFDEINDNLMYSAYFRMVSAFEGMIYENPDLKPYGFDPKKAREHLSLAGFTKRGKDGIFAKEDGTRASFSFTYGSPGLTRHVTVVKQKFKRLGIEMELDLLEGGTAFKKGLERDYQCMLMSRTTNFFPGPHQYFHSDFLPTTNNNNIWAYGTPETDKLIDVYRFDEDADARLKAMHELDAAIQDAAFYIPLWQAPFVRVLHWNDVQFPRGYFPKRFQRIENSQVFWIDTDKEAELMAAKKSGKSLTVDGVVDVDAYGIKAAMEKSMSSLSN